MISRKQWSFSKGIKKVCFGCLALLIILAPNMVSAARDPHVFMEDTGRCVHCHKGRPAGADSLFTRDIVTLCRECHLMADRMSHPVDIRPSDRKHSGLPLDRQGTITCATCHDPHSEPFSATPYVDRGIVERLWNIFSSTGYRTYFLRMVNTEGQLCLSCHDREDIDSGYLETAITFERDYTGSKACKRCHEAIYSEWEKTPHARTLQDPRVDSAALAAAFSGKETFRPEDVEIVIGVHWSQRYVIDRGGELAVAREVWSLDGSEWEGSFWWEQPWRDYCAGCHLTGFDPYEISYVEKGVGCEMCHGPGGGHVRSGQGDKIVNPARINEDQASSICASCHTIGHDRTGQFRYPVGYVPGQDLERYYLGLLPHVGQGEETYKGDGTLEDRLRSLSSWFEQMFRPSRIGCRQFKGQRMPPAEPETGRIVDLTLAQYCLSCHEEIYSEPDHRLQSGKDVNCHSCHTPLKDSLGRNSIHDHKYVFDGLIKSPSGSLHP
jgi:hypothetical protein